MITRALGELEDAASLAALREEARQLQEGLESRTTIGQAQGLLMAWFDIDPDQAFSYLKRRSNHEQRKLVDIAAELVRTKQRPHAAPAA